MKSKQAAIFFTLFFTFMLNISCVNKSPVPDNTHSTTIVAIHPDLNVDTLTVNAEKESKSRLTLIVKAIRLADSDKYYWVNVKVLYTIKNDVNEQVPDSLDIASFPDKVLVGPQEGKIYLVYLIPYPFGNKEITDIDKWFLLEGDGSVGAELIE